MFLTHFIFCHGMLPIMKREADDNTSVIISVTIVLLIIIFMSIIIEII